MSARPRRHPAAVGGAVLLAVSLLGLLPAPAASQPATVAPDVGVEDLAWLTGSWRGAGPVEGSVAEIHFMEPAAGVQPSVFRLLQGDRVVVLEAISVVEEEGRLVMYVRHFDPALVPLEEEHAIEMVLVERDGPRFVFENAREGENPRRSVMARTGTGFVSTSELHRPDGTVDEIRVEYERIPPG